MIKELTIENMKLPEGWKMKTLGEVCNIQNGFAYKSKSYVNSGYRVIRIGNVQNGQIIDKSPRYINESLAKEKEQFIIKEGDILTSLTGDVGRVGVFPEKMLPAVLNQRVGRFFNIHFSTIDTKYLLLFLKSKKFEEEVILGATGAAQKNTSTKKILEVKIPTPPLPQQKQIVATLDKAFAAIDTAKANAEQNLQNAKELFESYCQNIFENDKENWNEKSIGEVCSLFQGLAINAKTKHFLVDKSTLPLLRIKDLRKNTAEQYINDEKYPQSALVNKEDLIYTRTGNSLGLVFRGRYGILHNNSFKIVPKELLTRDYLFIWLKNPNFKSKIFSLASKAAQPDITHKIFKLQKIKIPPIKEQQQIVKKLNSLLAETKKLEAIYIQKIADLEEMKKSVLQKAFSGQLNTIN